MKKQILMVAVVATSMMLSGCSESILGGSDWTKSDSVDPFSDDISRRYSASIASGNGELVLGCSSENEINLYYSYTVRENSFDPSTAQIRIDEEKPRDEAWVVFGSVGNTWPENPQFIKELFGKDRLAIEIFARGSAVFDIRGISEAYDGLLEIGCSEKLS